MHEQHLHFALVTSLALWSVGATVLAREQEPNGPDSDARALFLANCATCHGENGDGKGTTELDRPARSFKDGGFSFGNTPDAIFRTVTYGIPGTPMPAFGAAFDDEQREALASYVISLGPGLPPPAENTEMVVGKRAVVVRGMLPPLTSTAILQPRGLAIGLPSGMTFEYRTDDVRLLGVRLGRFVDRDDWTGRGGTPLTPLGQVVHTFAGGNPEPMFRSAAGRSLTARFKGTWVKGATAGLRYDLLSEDGARIARATESCEPVATATASGFRRRIELAETKDGETFWLSAFDDSGANWAWEDLIDSGHRLREDGRLECFRVESSQAAGDSIHIKQDRAGSLSIAVNSKTTGGRELVLTSLISNDPAPAEPDRHRQFMADILSSLPRPSAGSFMESGQQGDKR